MSVKQGETSTTATTMCGKVVERLGDIVVAGVETTAQFSIGQGLLRAADRFLWVVEKSAQWSLPIHETTAEENGKAFGKIELVRPLPWIFFLPSLVMLRALRFGVNMGAIIFGYPKLEVIGLVKIIQKGRRRLRSIKSNGMRNIRCRRGSRNREEELNEAKKSLINSMLSTLSALSCLETSRRTPSPPPTRVYVQRGEPDATTTPEEESTTESASPQIDGKRKYSEVENNIDDSSESSEDESVRAKLDRLAAEDSDIEDEDFDPVKEELAIVSEGDGSSAEGDRDDDDDNDDDDDDDDDDDNDYLSDTEVEDLRRTCLETTNIAATPVGVIVEESEPELEASSTPKKENGIEECEKSEGINPTTSTPGSPLGRGDENTAKFYSPINSPGVDSPIDFKSPEKNDDDNDDDDDRSEQLTSSPSPPPPPPINDEITDDTSEKKNSSSQMIERQLDNGNPEKQAIASPKISGNSTDGIPATINNNNTSNNNNNNNDGHTEDEKRIIAEANEAKTQEKEKRSTLSESKKINE